MEPKFTTPRCEFAMDPGLRCVKVPSCAPSTLGRISGTMVAGILGCSPWASPFTVACELMGLGTEDISDKPAIRTGQALEARIIEYAGERYADIGTFLPAEAVYGARTGEHQDWEPDFEDEVFTGHVDGIIVAPDGKDYILEVKTSSNDAAWADGVPEYYWWQVALYDRFIAHRGVAYVVRGKVDQRAYGDPDSWTPSEGNVTMYRVELDQDKVSKGLARCETWREGLLLFKETPSADMSRPNDRALYDHLWDLSECERSFEDIVEEYGNVKRQKKAVDDEYQWLADKEERLKGLIRAHMEMHGIESAESRSGRFEVRVSETRRRSIDRGLLEEAGLDPEQYIKETVYSTVKVTERKERDIWQ